MSESWQLVIVADPDRRSGLRRNFEEDNNDSLNSYAGDKAKLCAKLKLSGMSTAPLQIAVFANQHTRLGHGLEPRRRH
ncbi:MAG: hypothetical protein VX941_11260 [Pseudomonadota bacterium]|nr:hypothetical protein [Pseudomonadota bacterium]